MWLHTEHRRDGASGKLATMDHLPTLQARDAHPTERAEKGEDELRKGEQGRKAGYERCEALFLPLPQEEDSQVVTFDDDERCATSER